jgi:hypothetical protein
MYSRLDKHTIKRIEELVNAAALSALKSSLETVVSDMFDESWDEDDVFEYIQTIAIDAIDNALDNLDNPTK